MNAKLQNKIALTIIKLIAGIVVLILAFLIGKILLEGLPHISWQFLTSPAKAF